MTIRQYRMLNEFMRQDHSIHQVLRFAQHTFGSLCKHKWIVYSVDKQAFHISSHGEEAFLNSSQRLFRENIHRPLSKYVPSRASKVVNIRKVA